MTTFLQSLIDATRQSTGLPTIFTPDKGKAVDYPAFNYPAQGASFGVPPDTYADDYRRLYKIQRDVYRCVWVISNGMASLGKRIIRVHSNGDKEDVTASKDFDILRDPSPYMSEYDFWENTSGFLELAGEAPWGMVLDGRGRPIEINPLRPDKITVIPSPSKLIDHYQFSNGGVKFRMEKDEVVFLKYWDPNNDYRGLSPLRAATLGLELELKAMKSNLGMIDNGGNPSGVLSYVDGEELDDDTWDRFKHDFREQYQGPSKRGSMMLLRGNMKWERMGLSNDDMQFALLLESAGDGVGEVYGVPPALRMKFKEASKLANAAEQHKIFWDDTMRPKGKKMAAMITKDLLPRLSNIPGIIFEFDFSDVLALQPNITEAAEQMAKGIEHGAAFPDDFREHILRLPRLNTPESTSLYQLSTLIPLGTTLSGQKRQDESPTGDVRSLAAGVNLTEKFDKILGRVFPGIDVGKTLSIAEEAKEVLARRWDESQEVKALGSLVLLRDRWAEKFEKGIALVFAGMGRELLASLHGRRAFWGTVGRDGIDATAFDFDIAGFVERLESVGRENLAGAVRDAANDLAADVAGTYDFNADPIAQQYVNVRSTEYSKLAGRWTSEHINAMLRSAIDESLTIDETAALIGDFFEKSAANQAAIIARTETVSAANHGRVRSMESNGFNWHMWATMRDERVREKHTQMDGEVVAIDKAFSNGSMVPDDIMERCYTIPQREGPKE